MLIKENKFKKKYKWFDSTYEEDSESFRFDNYWIHLKLSLALYFKKLLKDTLSKEMPLFDLSWDLSKLREDSPLVSLEEGCIEYGEKQFKYFTEFSWYRVQNFMINLFYNSLYYLYKTEDDENGLSTELMIHLSKLSFPIY